MCHSATPEKKVREREGNHTTGKEWEKDRRRDLMTAALCERYVVVDVK